MIKKKKKKKNDLYFAEKEEQAVVDYINTTSYDEKHRIYNEILRKPFQKMIESILRKYPIHVGNYDVNEVEANALSHLVEQMVKFKPDKLNKAGKKVKAFSYCQTIVRNFYKDHSKRSYNEKKNNLCFEDYSSEIIDKGEYTYHIDDEVNEVEVFMSKIVDKLRDVLDDDYSLKKNEVIVGEAIVNVLDNWHILFMEETPEGNIGKKVTNKYQKNKILQLLKEQTRLNTKEIRIAMKPFKEVYFMEKKLFIDSDE